jgi:ribokinase
LSVDQLASGLRNLGVGRLVLTLGVDGVRGFDGDADYTVPAILVDAVDTTGAGDTFCGAWAAETLRGASFREALAYANRAAAISVTRKGAQSSIPTRNEISRD